MNEELFRSFNQQGHGNKSTFAYRSSSSTRVSHVICCVNRSHWSVSFLQHENMTKYIHKEKKKGTRQRINVLIDQNGSPGLLFGVGGREGVETSVTAIKKFSLKCHNLRVTLRCWSRRVSLHIYLVANELCFSSSGTSSVQISTYCPRSQEIVLTRG